MGTGGLILLVIHHLGVSQSERIVWLCEELNERIDARPAFQRAIRRADPSSPRQIV